MKRLVSVLLMFLVLSLAGCGGATVEPEVEATIAPAADPTTEPTVAVEEAVATPEPETEAEPGEAATEPAGEDTDTEIESEVAAGIAIDQLVMSGTDPETGLPVNPDSYFAGDQFVIRGAIISMNLTPQTSPEFVIEAPSGQRYRFLAQSLADVYFRDGSQIRAHEYRQGMYGEATVELAPDAGPADILTSGNLSLIHVQP